MNSNSLRIFRGITMIALLIVNIMFAFQLQAALKGWSKTIKTCADLQTQLVVATASEQRLLTTVTNIARYYFRAGINSAIEVPITAAAVAYVQAPTNLDNNDTFISCVDWQKRAYKIWLAQTTNEPYIKMP